VCRGACPHNVIGLSETINSHGYRPVVLLDPEDRCTGCALCAFVCPDSGITVFKDVPAHPRQASKLEEGQ
jgi:2-oxoglutarate ferredoxin oxidoreductase subunit delta